MHEPTLPNPFRDAQEGRRRAAPPPGVGQKEWTRLYAMAVVFMLCVGTMIYVKKTMDAPKKEEKGLPAGQVQYSIEGAPKKPAQDPVPQPAPDPAKPVKVDVTVPPLPKDGAIDFKALAAPFKDGTEKPVKETPEFIQMLNVTLNAVKPEDVSKRVAAGLTTEAVGKDPAKHRGEVLRIYGRLIYIYTEKLETTTPVPMEYVYLGVMQEYPKNRTLYFYMPEKPKDPATGQPIEFKQHVYKGQTIFDDWVEIEGVFLRTYEYPGQKSVDDGKGDPLVRSLMFMVKNLRIVEKPKMTHTRSGFIFVVSILAAITVTIVLVAGIMSRRYGSDSLRQKAFAIKREQAKKEGRDIFAPKEGLKPNPGEPAAAPPVEPPPAPPPGA
jgi:hypothetical protein